MPDPFCDTCRKPAVFSELVGWRHSTTEHKFGVPTHLDTSGHEVTAKDWWADKPQYLTAEQVVGITRHYGVPVYWAGEGGDVVAIGSDWRRAMAAIHRFGRSEYGQPVCSYEPSYDSRWVRFWYPAGNDEWDVEECQPGDPGALHAFWAYEVGPYNERKTRQKQEAGQ